ncbi:MAG: oligoendopeptidase F [Mycoplasmataceae bacterium]|nr:oligoendopeptidase F [Mycoplasmataceae bacterium]
MNHHQYNWTLNKILKNQTLNELHQDWLTEQKQIIKLYSHFYKSKNHFIKWLKLNEQHIITSNRLSNYIHNNLNEDLTNPHWIAWSQKLNSQGREFATKLANYENIIIENWKTISIFLKDHNIQNYQRSFDLIFRHKEHRLSKDEEVLMSKISNIHGGFETIFETLTDSDIKFSPAINSQGQVIPLTTIADVTKNIKSKDRKLRETTWINFNKAFHAFESTLTQTLYYNYLMLNTNAKIYKFKDYVSAVAFEDEISANFILNLYALISRFQPLAHDYRIASMNKLKKMLHLNVLKPWDKNVELIKININFSIEQAKELVLVALKPLGEEYLAKVQEAFDQQWISWLAKPNKHTGAYSIGGTKGLEAYYISMNFDNSLNSVSTIIHELGHSMNSYYTNLHQKIYTTNSIFCAEIASIVNEQLLYYCLLDKYQADKKMKLYVLDKMLSNFFATTTRQIIFSNFEFIMNEKINNNEPFTKETILKTYQAMVQKYQGFINDEQKSFNKEPYVYGLSTIFRISHFYVGNFYVYKYAVGQIVAIIVADAIYHGDQTMLKKYFQFLSSGSSLSPLNTIKLLNIDLTSPKVFRDAKQIVCSWIKKFKQS